MKYRLAIVLILVISASSCKTTVEPDENQEAPTGVVLSVEQQEEAGIIIGRAEERTLSGRLACNGRIETPPNSRARISSLMNGYVKEIRVYDGKFVNRGEVLAVLEHPDFLSLQEEFLLEKSRNEFLRLDYERQKGLNDKNINSEKEMQRVRSEYEQSGIKLSSLRSMLEMLGADAEHLNSDNLSTRFQLKAPIGGFVEGITIALGQFVQPDEVIVELVNRNEFLIVLQVFEKDIASVEPGQKVSFLCPDPQSVVTYHYGRIIYTGQKIDETSRTFQVYASPDDDYPNMRHGMMIRADIELTGSRQLSVPVEAIVYSSDGEYIFVREGDRFRPVRVETGAGDRGFVGILNGDELAGREIVIEGGVYLLAEMQKE